MDKETVKLLLALALSAGGLLVYINKVPKIEERVDQHDVKFATMETKLGAIEKNTDEIKSLLMGRGRR